MLLALAGCDGGDDEAPAAGAQGEPGEGGTLVWALERAPTSLDPLLARERAEQLVTRQIHDPLVEELTGPFGDVPRESGLALASRPSSDNTIWRLHLRRGIRFQDGSAFNASAVLANAERWQSLPEGRELLPDLLAVDAPRPDLVRFILTSPDPALDRRLASPRLGIVSPRALRRGAGGGLLQPGSGSGTGAFELRERGSGTLLLARNTAWWGLGRGLGPALDQLEFTTVADGRDRLELLAEGEVQAADSLGRQLAREARSDPLLTALPQGDGEWLGLERSVHGIDSARAVPSLQSAWLTSIGP